jgi:hypothetical protein
LKSFKSIQIVKIPVEDAWVAIRDRLGELVPYLDEIESVAVQERSVMPENAILLVNLWQAKAKFPAVLSAVIKSDMLMWTDRATWHEKNHECAWQIELHFAPDRTRCTGLTTFEPAIGGRGTRITFAGEFSLNAKGLPGVPSILESTVAAAAESFVTSLIPGNFRKLAMAAETLVNSSLPVTSGD